MIDFLSSNGFSVGKVMFLTDFNHLPHNPDFLTPLEKKAFENIVEKGENAGNQHFLLFPQCFLLFPTQISVMFECLSCLGYNDCGFFYAPVSKDLGHIVLPLSVCLSAPT